MSTITFLGQEYKTQDLQRETVALAAELARNVRLLEPLPTDIDLSNAEQEKIQTQVHLLPGVL